MIAKTGDKVVVTADGEHVGVQYNIGDTGVMVYKAHGDDYGGYVELHSGGIVYLYKSEYKVITDQSSASLSTVTAESLRNRFYEIEKEEEEISKKIDALSEEKSKIEDDLRLMGFMLCSPVQQDFMPILDDSPEIDYDDPRNWKKGDVVECVNAEGWGDSFVSGGLYNVLERDFGTLYIETEQGEKQPVTCTVVDFKFHSPF